MIDTDKYEGHDNWEGTKVNMANEANKLLIADAPLILAEVKELQKQVDNLRKYCHEEGYDIFNWEVKNIEVIE